LLLYASFMNFSFCKTFNILCVKTYKLPQLLVNISTNFFPVPISLAGDYSANTVHAVVVVVIVGNIHLASKQARGVFLPVSRHQSYIIIIIMSLQFSSYFMRGLVRVGEWKKYKKIIFWIPWHVRSASTCVSTVLLLFYIICTMGRSLLALIWVMTKRETCKFSY